MYVQVKIFVMNLVKNKKKIHILLIAVGMLFTILPLFHTSLWFDESYSVSLASHSFSEIWSIDIHDVHPVFYYDCLHLLYLVFGSNILVYRLFSWACLSMIGIFGYTGIRRDFGEDTGIWFTFFVFFFPVNVVYAGEIRMYMLVCLLVLLGTFYAIRIAKGSKNRWEHLRMVLFFVLAAYTHYYGLLAAAMVNLILLSILIVHHKQSTKREYGIWLLDGLLQIGMYLPWLFVFISQAGAVKQNFWIRWYWPSTLIEMILFQFSGNLGKDLFLPAAAAAGAEAAFAVYLIVMAVKDHHEHIDEKLLTLGTYTGVIAAAALAGILMHRVIVYARYLLVCTGLLLLYISDAFARCGRKIISSIFCAAVAICAVCANMTLIKTNYAPSNQAPYEYLEANMQAGDVILVSNYLQDPNSFIAVSRYMDHRIIYWNECAWMDESVKAYRAYGTDMTVVYNLNDVPAFSGRVWVIYADDDDRQMPINHVYNAVISHFHGTGEGTHYFQTDYKNIEYTIGLVSVGQ